MSNNDRHVPGESTLVIEGGDLACGELLMLVFRQIRDQQSGTMVAITTSDPAAPLDIPAWCHLTGHHYRGVSTSRPRDTHLVELSGVSRPVDPARPWHREPETNNTSAPSNSAPSNSAKAIS